MRSLFLLLLVLCCAEISFAQVKSSRGENVVGLVRPLIAGPMLGHVDMREAAIWMQTSEEGQVVLNYWPADRVNEKQSLQLPAKKENAMVVCFELTLLEYGTAYQYEILVNGQKYNSTNPLKFETLLNWQYREPVPNFSFAVGSCAYVNDEAYDRKNPKRGPYGGDYSIFNQIVAKEADFMLWLGDNIYLRPPDWNDFTGIVYRYSSMRKLPELQKLMVSMPQYAIWDDHDYGPNDSDRSYVHKEASLEAFKLFWANPSYGLPGEGGITTQFVKGDVEFFLLDNRYFRAPNKIKKGEKTILGETQLEWIVDALVSSRATFKMVAVGGQVLNTAEAYETYANVAPEERAYLLRRIEEEGITGVVFLNGDRHHSEMSRLDLANGNWVLEVTASPLTSRSHLHPEEPNTLRIDGSYQGVRNFALLEVTGEIENRKLEITYYDTIGKELWSYSVDAPARE